MPTHGVASATTTSSLEVAPTRVKLTTLTLGVPYGRVSTITRGTLDASAKNDGAWAKAGRVRLSGRTELAGVGTLLARPPSDPGCGAYSAERDGAGSTCR